MKSIEISNLPAKPEQESSSLKQRFDRDGYVMIPQFLNHDEVSQLVDEENGCVRYVPGSHRQGLRPHASTDVLGFSQGISGYSDADRALEIPMPAKPGDILIHHSPTIHSAGSNRSPRTRKALGFIYYSSRPAKTENVTRCTKSS
jgi:ectoine hydroxylase-related dioxygenase (phytanoyl-CoA dioxygenase family)